MAEISPSVGTTIEAALALAGLASGGPELAHRAAPPRKPGLLRHLPA
jgi:hypothetical protein